MAGHTLQRQPSPVGNWVAPMATVHHTIWCRDSAPLVGPWGEKVTIQDGGRRSWLINIHLKALPPNHKPHK